MHDNTPKTSPPATFHCPRCSEVFFTSHSSVRRWPGVPSLGARHVGFTIESSRSGEAYPFQGDAVTWTPTKMHPYLIFDFNRETSSGYARTGKFWRPSTSEPTIAEWASTPRWFLTVERCFRSEPALRNSSMNKPAT